MTKEYAERATPQLETEILSLRSLSRCPLRRRESFQLQIREGVAISTPIGVKQPTYNTECIKRQRVWLASQAQFPSGTRKKKRTLQEILAIAHATIVNAFFIMRLP